MKLIHRVILTLLVSTLIPTSSSMSAESQPNPSLLAQQSNEAALQEAKQLNEQASELYQQGNYAEAEPLFQRALQISEQSLGSTHPAVATLLNNLAMVYLDQRNYAEAEPLFQRALQISEQSLGSTHPEVATSLNNLALLYSDQGNYAEAEPLFQRALQIREQNLGSTHPDVALALNNLAMIYHEQGNYTAAEPLYQRALQIYEQNHLESATTLNNLAFLYSKQGDYAVAEPLFQRALQILEKTLGSTHPDVATTLHNLASHYHEQGNYALAEPLYQRALQIFEQTLGSTHPDVAITLHNLALIYHNQGNSERVLPLLNRSLDIEEANLAEMLSIGSEARKQAYANTLKTSTFQTLSLNQQSSQSPKLTRLAFETLLRRKGRMIDAAADSNRRLRENFNDADKPLFDQLQVQQAQLAALMFQPIEQGATESYRTEVARLKQQINELENTLAQRSAKFRIEVEPVTLEAVQAELPPESALVELTQYNPYNFETNRWQPARYAAYVLTTQGVVQTVDLGEAAVIDQSISEFRQALLEPQSQVKPIARQLDALLMQPIRAHTGNATHLLISPDGQLNLLPFAALVDENDQYLIENYQITHLTSGRDLLRYKLSEPSQQPSVVMADPNYNQATAIASTSASAQSNNQASTQPNNQPNNQQSADASNLNFNDLPGTAEEGSAIAALLPNPTLLLEGNATENLLKQIQSPKILHIATHGFFLQSLPLVPPPDVAATRSFDSDTLAAPPPEELQENPLLRSGLVLAGANQRNSGDEDGILTALEAAGLDLRGTQLVVLSACETGIGQVATGEGVYGLRRSLVIAGAQSQLISLWLVNDTGTKDLMIDYYQRLLAGEGRSKALRQTQLAMLHNEEYNRPYFWASFISSGDWAPLK
jgi:CHAT domain-containing protein/Tfp pilus assembly protein PilF